MELISTLGQALFGVLMDKCRNCGHDSHCGTRYVADIDRSGNEIEVCKYCRCEKCQDRD